MVWLLEVIKEVLKHGCGLLTIRELLQALHIHKIINYVVILTAELSQVHHDLLQFLPTLH